MKIVALGGLFGKPESIAKNSRDVNDAIGKPPFRHLARTKESD